MNPDVTRLSAAVPRGGAWIDAYDVPSLQTLCRARGIPVREGTAKATLRGLLASELLRSSILRSLLDDLQPSERSWLEFIDHAGGRLSRADTNRGRLECGDAGLRRLASRGLVLPGPFDGANGDGQLVEGAFDVMSPAGPVWCPESVLLRFAGGQPEPKVSPYEGDVEGIRNGDFRRFEHDLMAFADTVRQAPVRKLKSGYPGKRFLARVAERFLEPIRSGDLERFETSGRVLLVFEVLEALGVIRTRHDRLTTDAGADEFFGMRPVERVRRVFDAWCGLTRYNEMYRIGELKLERAFPDYENGDGKADDLPTAERLVAARSMLGELATSMPPGVWVAIDELLEAAYLVDDAFLIKAPQSFFYAHAPLYLGIYPADRDGTAGGVWSWGLERAGNWSLVEGRFIREVFADSFHAIGLLDVAETPDGEPLVRLNDLGAHILAGGPEPELTPAPGRSLIVQPNFDVVIFPEGQDVGLLWPLLQAAEVINRDVTLTLRLTADSIHRASQQNIPAQNILEVLESHARAPVPENVRKAMGDWEHRFQQVAITTFVDLVEAESPERFSRMLEEANVGQTVVRPLSDTVGVVVGPVSKLPPMTTFDYQETLPKSVTVSDDLDVTIDTGRENWLVRAKLAAIADRTGPDSYRVTRSSAAHAAERGHFYDEALELLRGAAVDGLPRRAAFKLQGLFGHLGPASVGEVTLIRTARETVLSAMLEIDDFRDIVLQRLGPETALVNSRDVERLLATLEAFGIPNDPDALRERHLSAARDASAEADAAKVRQARLQTYSTRKTRELLEDAIRRGRRVRLRYRPHAGGRAQERTVDPIDVERRHGVAYLTAFCHLRGEVQVFRIPSIVALELLDTPVSPR